MAPAGWLQDWHLANGYLAPARVRLMTNMTTLSFRLEKVADQNRIYFIITAFPAL